MMKFMGLRRFLVLCVVLLPLMAHAAERRRLNFNPAWMVMVGDPAGAEQGAFDDDAWKPVTLPYAWNEDSAFKVSIHDLPTGVAWYRKHFVTPRLAPGARVLIEFEGIRQAGAVYVNGQFVGLHEDGVMAFGYDLTKYLRPAPEENVIAVRTDNRWDYREKATGTVFQWNNANFYANYGGISKSVWLHVTAGPVYQTLPLYSGMGTTGQYIYADEFHGDGARITAETEVKNDSSREQHVTYMVTVKDRAGKQVARFEGDHGSLAAGETTVLKASARVEPLHLWSWGYGYLYDVATTVLVDGRPVDAVVTRTGFRETEFGNGVTKLNGRVIQFHGYAQRTTNEWPGIGLSVPPWVSDLSNRAMVEGNANLVRWMHVTPWKQDVESCDRVGLPESMPAGDAEGDPKGRQWEQRVELMRDAIIYNRNNPSILFYESGNRGVNDEHMAAMKRVRDRYDPHGGRAIGSREVLASHTAEYGGEMLYINKSGRKPLWAHEYSRDEAARKFWDGKTPPFHKDSPQYNRNQDSFAVEDVRRWYDYFAARPGSGTRVSDGGVNIVFADSNTHYRGDNNYRRSGEVDAMRIPKDGYFAHQVMWDGWVDPEHPHLHIVGHWNYAEGVTKPVVVVSNAEKVELFLNDRSLGFGQQSSRFLYTFEGVAFHPGRLRAVGYDAAGKKVTEEVLNTVGAPVAIRLTPHTGPGGLHADGADLALIDVEVVDKDGRRSPTALNPVTFRLTGPGEWRGGIAQGSSHPVPRNEKPNDNHGLSKTPPTTLLFEDNYILAKTLPVEGGINRVSVRSKPKAGVITLTAEAEGLKPATITLRTVPVAVTGGIATWLPDAGLAAYVERGPTPAGPSFTPWRVELPIASATAGSHAETVSRSFDDDETTGWASDGVAATAWVEYTLAREGTIGEIDLKLNAFRTRHYPVRVEVDGVQVYAGETPTSLGYCTLRFAGVRGRRVRIVMSGPPVDDRPAEAEITGKVDSAGISPVSKDDKTLLSIIEAEIYQPRSRE
jgi:hypothetical protein